MSKRHFITLFATLAATFAMGATAQSIPELPPLPQSAADNASMRIESCDQVLCAVSAAQLRALDRAKSLYAVDQSSSKSYSAVVDASGEEVTITLIPTPPGSSGRAISYVFDRSGNTLVRSFINR